jgi:SAM-dependent methyltransferase
MFVSRAEPAIAVVPVVRSGSARAAYLDHRYGGTQRLLAARERQVVAALLEDLPGSLLILDAPSGYGRFTPLLATRGQVVSCDISRKRLHAVTDGAAALPLVQADLRGGFPFATDVFDLVFAFRYFHHLHGWAERAALVAELVRVSRRFVIVSYYAGRLHALVKKAQFLPRSYKRLPATFVRRRTLHDLFRSLDCRLLADVPVLPMIHAHRVALIEKAA